MSTKIRPVRFPRQAIARRLIAIMDQLKSYREAYEELQVPGITARRDDELQERIEFLDNTWHELEAVVRGLQYWR